jgi:hypothetical protein
MVSFSEACDLTEAVKRFAPFSSDFHADLVDWPMATENYLTRKEDLALFYNLGRLVASLDMMMSLKMSKALAYTNNKQNRLVLTYALDRALND